MYISQAWTSVGLRNYPIKILLNIFKGCKISPLKWVLK